MRAIAHFERIQHDPHQLLGLHESGPGKVVRLWRPGAEEAWIELQGNAVALRRVDETGLFELQVPADTELLSYRIFHPNGLLAHDPYAFWPTLGEVDLHLFGQGVHYELYKVMGGRLAIQQGVEGVKFAVWAPSAQRVSLVGDFNRWDGRVNPMRSLGHSGVWELFVPGLQEGMRYKFEITTQTGELRVKADPFAYAGELRPRTASLIADLQRFDWADQEWMKRRKAQRNTPQPISIYEVHLGSWRRPGGCFLSYRDLAHQLADYCRDMGFTHVELMPIAEHPLDESWGYQVSGFYAVTSRFGTPEEFQYFVDYLHRQEIGVILDWVPGHFPSDDFSLARFDGTHLYEHADPRQGLHPHWFTQIFNFGRREVSNFLIANALFWLDQMHIDGLRVDAVASMLYLDYGREEGDWIPNLYGGRENLEAIEFFKHLHSVLQERQPGTFTVAEESTAFPQVSHPVSAGGLGFTYKWNMGWMNDTLRYFSKDPFYRHHHHNDLTFGLLYAFTERFVLVLSHDEVTHGKGSLLGKMAGDYWQRFANLRLLLSYQMCQPGKKMLFMGGEFGQWNEWDCKKELDWILLDFPIHRGLQQMVKALNHFYRDHKALWEDDFSHHGFSWVDFADSRNCVISYLRKGGGEQLLCVHNFTPAYYGEYIIHLRHLKEAQEIFNSDAERFGGSGKAGLPVEILPHGLKIRLAPLATQIFRLVW